MQHNNNNNNRIFMMKRVTAMIVKATTTWILRRKKNWHYRCLQLKNNEFYFKYGNLGEILDSHGFIKLSFYGISFEDSSAALVLLDDFSIVFIVSWSSENQLPSCLPNPINLEEISASQLFSASSLSSTRS
mmetsp:Transcript_30787/g.61982  ORF Transcript_30787/g.61982 Transcript_30787/m.61982 type:complete len:131 (+) Transcript_30787:261-653(+)